MVGLSLQSSGSGSAAWTAI